VSTKRDPPSSVAARPSGLTTLDVRPHFCLSLLIDKHYSSLATTFGHFLQVCFTLLCRFQPKQAMGNHEATREIEGEAWPRLALYRRLHPEATIDMVQAFLFNMDPTIAPYCPSAIVKAEFILNVKNKPNQSTQERLVLDSKLSIGPCGY
jgi:hypothetical protein